jgi:hypothetical protein
MGIGSISAALDDNPLSPPTPPPHHQSIIIMLQVAATAAASPFCAAPASPSVVIGAGAVRSGSGIYLVPSAGAAPAGGTAGSLLLGAPAVASFPGFGTAGVVGVAFAAAAGVSVLVPAVVESSAFFFLPKRPLSLSITLEAGDGD